MRISDWSSDVCSSDLCGTFQGIASLCPHRRFFKRGTKLCPTRCCAATEKGVVHGLQRPPHRRRPRAGADRKSVVSGKSVSVRVDLGGRSCIKKKNTKHKSTYS